MADMRMNLVKSLENILLDYMEPDEINEVSDKMIIMLGDCEITKRCTDIVPKDTTNDKLISIKLIWRSNMSIINDKQNIIYVTYDSNLKKELTKHNIDSILYGLHPKTNKMFWVYERSSELNNILNIWFSK